MREAQSCVSGSARVPFLSVLLNRGILRRTGEVLGSSTSTPIEKARGPFRNVDLLEYCT